MEDSCAPVKHTFQTQRVYSLLFPSLFLILFVEFLFIMLNFPDSLGSSGSVKGTLPSVPAGLISK